LAVFQEIKPIFVGKNFENRYRFVPYTLSFVFNSCKKPTLARPTGYERCHALDLWFFCAYLLVFGSCDREVGGVLDKEKNG